jgi:hypothetical protein
MPGLPSTDFRNGVADRLHETIDERCLQLHAGGRVDAPGGDKAVFQGFVEASLPLRALGLGLGQGEGARHAAAHLLDGILFAFGVLLDQRLAADLLVCEGGED